MSTEHIISEPSLIGALAMTTRVVWHLAKCLLFATALTGVLVALARLV